jgi:hypothetical protein
MGDGGYDTWKVEFPAATVHGRKGTVDRLDTIIFPACSVEDIDKIVVYILCNTGQFALPLFRDPTLDDSADLGSDLLCERSRADEYSCIAESNPAIMGSYV